MLRVVNYIVLALYISSLFLVAPSASAELNEPPSLIFSEVKVRYDSSDITDFNEFIELYNPSLNPIDLTNYELEYFNTPNPVTSQIPQQKPIDNNFLAAGEHLVLAKQPSQIPFSKQTPISSLADSGGKLRLVTTEGDIVDEIAWTNDAILASDNNSSPVIYMCNAPTAICNVNRTQSIQRTIHEDGIYDFSSQAWELGIPSPISSKLLEPQSPEEPEQEEEQSETEEMLTCEGVFLNEILPNPAGSDIGNEFIELYNTTDEIIELEGCELQTSANSRTFKLNGLQLNPQEFLSLKDSTTGLTLPNSAGGTVWLLSPTEELSQATYPGNLEDDSSWAYISSAWQVTYAPTPGTSNIEMPFKPCPSGQVRNLESNRCVSIVTKAVASLVPCKPGQFRNVATNRCRSTLTSNSVLTPCKTGQERNPETNRCRNIDSGNQLQQCPEGQERNSETNRCRKVLNNSQTLASVTDIPSTHSTNSSRWLFAIIAILLALGYGIYEWRQDIQIFLSNTWSKLKRLF